MHDLSAWLRTRNDLLPATKLERLNIRSKVWSENSSPEKYIKIDKYLKLTIQRFRIYIAIEFSYKRQLFPYWAH